MGYDFTQAVADIVDNSIEAKASKIHIDLEFDGDESWIRIADNGKGMNPEVLREAMRFGSESDYDEDSLGKFGLGLKTASMSQCQRLSVATRWNPDRADVSAYCWDLNHIETTNRWEVLPLDRNGLGPSVLTPLKVTTGTVVLWQQLDRILGYKLPYGEFARKKMSQLCRELEAHIGMVFHRFITGGEGQRKVKIFVNDNEVAAWDPFCRAEPKTQKLQEVKVQVDHEGIKGEVLLQSYILPHQDNFSTQEAFKLASGPLNWNQQQGIYIYRSGRMIQSGGWCRLRTADEHTKLARVALSFSPKLDEAFKVNVAKMRVQLPSQIREDVEKAISPVVKLARERYDKKTVSKGQVPKDPPSISAQTSTGRESKDLGTTRSITKEPIKLSISEFQALAYQYAEPSEKQVVLSIFDRIREHFKET